MSHDFAKIPAFIHQTWRNADVPDYLEPFRRSWAHFQPDWEMRLWTDEDNRALIADHYHWFLETYDAYSWPIQRADAVRYFILHRHGGLYVDLDFECLRPIGPVLEGRGCVLGREPTAHARSHRLETLVANALMASAPNHPFWPHVHRLLVRKSDARTSSGEADVLNSTGPLMLTEAVASYEGRVDGTDPWLAAPGVFYPMVDATSPTVFDGFGSTQAERQKRYLERVLRRDYPPEAYAVHHWAGTWFDDHERKKALIESMQSGWQGVADE